MNNFQHAVPAFCINLQICNNRDINSVLKSCAMSTARKHRYLYSKQFALTLTDIPSVWSWFVENQLGRAESVLLNFTGKNIFPHTCSANAF